MILGVTQTAGVVPWNSALAVTFGIKVLFKKLAQFQM